MKKSYIEPATTVVALKVRSNMLQSSPGSQQVFSKSNARINDGNVLMEGREAIDNPDDSEDWDLWK